LRIYCFILFLYFYRDIIIDLHKMSRYGKLLVFYDKKMVGGTGFEPVTFSV
jgi:hypothetical protein